MAESIYFLTLALSIVVAFALLLLPLRRRLCQSWSKNLVVIGSTLCVCLLLIALLPSSAAETPWTLEQWSALKGVFKTTILVASAVVAMHLLSGVRYAQLLFLALLVKSYSEYVLTVSLVAQQTFFPHQEPLVLVFMGGLYLFTFWLMILFLERMVRPLMEEGEWLPFWSYLWLVPAGFYVVYCLGIYTNYLGAIGQTAKFAGLSIMLFWTLGTFATYFVIVKMLSITISAARVQEQLTVSELQMEMQRRRLESLQSAIEETRRTRHDLRHHVAALSTMMQRRDFAAAEDYLDQLAAAAPVPLEQKFSENRAVDAILGYYVSLCQELRIETDLSVAVPQDLGGAEKDVCVVLSNLLENACEACAHQKKGPRTLRLRARLSGDGMLALTVRNSFSGQIAVDKQGNFLSGKRGGQAPGLGTQSVRSMAEKQGGAARFSYTEAEFTASVLLHL